MEFKQTAQQSSSIGSRHASRVTCHATSLCVLIFVLKQKMILWIAYRKCFIYCGYLKQLSTFSSVVGQHRELNVKHFIFHDVTLFDICNVSNLGWRVIYGVPQHWIASVYMRDMCFLDRKYSFDYEAYFTLNAEKTKHKGSYILVAFIQKHHFSMLQGTVGLVIKYQILISD